MAETLKEKRNIEVCFSPISFPLFKNDESIVVIVDILRATTAICSALANGAVKIIPVAKVEETKEYKNSGCLIAGERDGKVIDGADFGNSPFNFTRERVFGQSIVITTTNGTQAIDIARNAASIVLGAFTNIEVLSKWLINSNKDIVILCSGWKNKFNIEDSLFAGALIELIEKSGNFQSKCDSAIACGDLWNLAKNDLIGYIQKCSHRERLRKLGLDDVIEYCFTLNTANVIPILKENSLVNLLEIKGTIN
ncbi:MAG: 2-phosphosulfolactate phosphatase [Bacteroidetes bacterium]|nr:2-phosphosulfolactate phosphatase [Bacteroidota bacterium]